MGSEGLDTFLLPYVPELGEGVTCARNELVVIERVDAQTHHISQVIGEFRHLRARFNIPENAGHVTRRGEDPSVVDEATAAEIARVAGQFASYSGGSFPGREVVDRADVVKAAAGDEVAAGGIGAGHDPRRAQRNGVHLIRGVCVPDDEFAILRCGHEVPPIGGPVHGVDLGQVALERALRLHG